MCSSDLSDTQINLTWTDTTFAETSVRVLRRLTNGTSWGLVTTLAANSTSYSDTGLTAATGYTYAVAAVDASGNVAVSGYAAATTLAEVVIAPSGLSATPYSSNQINLSWTDNSSNETGFRILRRLTSDATFSTVTTLAANSTTYQDTGLNPSTSYTFAVAAIGASGSVTSSSSVAATTPANPMIAPTGLTATAVSPTQINLAWTDASSNETGFRVLRRLTSDVTWSIVTTTAANSTSYSVTGLSPLTSYTFSVASVNALGDYATSTTAAATTLSNSQIGRAHV